MLQVSFAHGFAALDGPVENRLGERRFVAFVMAQPAVAEHVDEDVAMKLLAKIHRQPHHLRDRFRVFAVHMENRALQHPRHVRGINAGTPFAGRVVKPI